MECWIWASTATKEWRFLQMSRTQVCSAFSICSKCQFHVYLWAHSKGSNPSRTKKSLPSSCYGVCLCLCKIFTYGLKVQPDVHQITFSNQPNNWSESSLFLLFATYLRRPSTDWVPASGATFAVSCDAFLAHGWNWSFSREKLLE